MKVILIDDEISILMILKRMLSKICDIEIVGAFQCTKQAELFIQYNNVDVVFIDINMSEENGISFAKRVLQEIESIEVIFVTSHKEYALEAFDVYAFDYIVKPISGERVYQTISKIKHKKATNTLTIEKPVENNFKLFIYCLGRFDILSEDKKETLKLPTSKCEELLSYLIMNRGKSVSRWKLVEDLFSGMDQCNADIYLNTTTYKLRKALQAHGLKEIIVYANKRYKLETQNIYIDLIDFENRVNNITTIRKEDINYAIESENLFDGNLFGEKGYCWALPEQEKLAAVYSNFAKQLSEKLLEIGNYYLALKVLKKLEHRDGLDEGTNSLLMRVYHSNNDKISLIKQYKKYQEGLKIELNTTPEDSIVKLYKKLKNLL